MKNAMMPGLFGVLFSVLTVGGATAQGLPDPNELKGQITQEAEKIAELRALMASPDPEIATATFNVLINSDHAMARAIAFEDALSSADPVLRHMGIRAKFFDATGFVIEHNADFSDAFQRDFREKDINTGSFEIKYGWFTGRVVGDQIELKTDNHCYAEFEYDGDKYMVGQLVCDGEAQPARIRIR